MRGYLPSRGRRSVFGRWNDTLVRVRRKECECTPCSAAFFAPLAFASACVAVHPLFNIPLCSTNSSVTYILGRQPYSSCFLWWPFLGQSPKFYRTKVSIRHPPPTKSELLKLLTTPVHEKKRGSGPASEQKYTALVIRSCRYRKSIPTLSLPSTPQHRRSSQHVLSITKENETTSDRNIYSDSP